MKSPLANTCFVLSGLLIKKDYLNRFNGSSSMHFPYVSDGDDTYTTWLLDSSASHYITTDSTYVTNSIPFRGSMGFMTSNG